VANSNPEPADLHWSVIDELHGVPLAETPGLCRDQAGLHRSVRPGCLSSGVVGLGLIEVGVLVHPLGAATTASDAIGIQQ
jgi:hypothetical protein